MTTGTQSGARETIIGDVVGTLDDGEPGVVDPSASVDVLLANSDKWLVSADEAALDAGANLAAVGDELIQYASAVPLATGLFRLSGLRRGVRGSGAMCVGHASGETFVLIVPEALRVLTFQSSQVGMLATISAYGVGNKEDPPQVSRVVSA